MKASTVTSTAQAPTSLPAPAQTLFLTEHAQDDRYEFLGKSFAEQIQIRANTITVVLSDLMTIDDSYRDFGIND